MARGVIRMRAYCRADGDRYCRSGSFLAIMRSAFSSEVSYVCGKFI